MTVLVIASHADDQVLGCGGTMARLHDEGHEIYVHILGRLGYGARQKGTIGHRKEREVKEEVERAHNILGVRKTFYNDIPDQRFDCIDLLDIIGFIERVKKSVEPDIIFTHTHKCLNMDHAITNRAVLTATRPVLGETVKTIYTFEIPSSTEWNFNEAFKPNVFFSINPSQWGRKLKALTIHKEELRNPPHPRSSRYIHALASIYSGKSGIDGYVEAFELVREIK